jgi:hypothetical protein
MKNLSFFGFILLIMNVKLFAQQEPEKSIFTATAILGFNASQIDGDETAGYNKFGLNVGARAGVKFAPNWEVDFEILFSQQGSQSTFVRGQPRDFVLDLNYIEVPILVHYKDWLVKSETGKSFHRFYFGVGASYNRLLFGKENSLNGTLEGDQLFAVANPYLKNHIMLIADINFYFTRNWGINLRYERAPMNIRENKYFNPHMIVFRGLFTF